MIGFSAIDFSTLKLENFLLKENKIGVAARAEDWRWSNVAAYSAGQDDAFIRDAPLLDIVHNWKEFLQIDPTEEEIDLMRRHERTVRPMGDPGFIAYLEKSLYRPLHAQKPGPKKGIK